MFLGSLCTMDAAHIRLTDEQTGSRNIAEPVAAGLFDFERVPTSISWVMQVRSRLTDVVISSFIELEGYLRVSQNPPAHLCKGHSDRWG